MKKVNRGNVLAPVLAVVALLVGGLFVFWALRGPEASPPPGEAPAAALPELGSPLIWGDFGATSIGGLVPPASGGRQTIRLGPTAAPVFQVTVNDPAARVTLKNPAGEIIKPSEEATVPVAGQNQTVVRTLTFRPTNNRPSGNWTVELNNPNPNAPLDYSVEVPEGAPPLVISPQTDQTANTGQGVTITLVVQETVFQVTVPVTGATVVAIITDPNGNVTIVPLVETAPGVYTGVYVGNQTAGIYQVDYQITGVDQDGNQFTETTNGQFVVAPETAGQSGSYGRRYDINRSGEVQIIGY